MIAIVRVIQLRGPDAFVVRAFNQAGQILVEHLEAGQSVYDLHARNAAMNLVTGWIKANRPSWFIIAESAIYPPGTFDQRKIRHGQSAKI